MDWRKRQRIQEALGKEPSTMELVPDSFEIGYEVMGNKALRAWVDRGNYAGRLL